MMKTCTKCGEEKPLDEYYKNKKCRGGRLTRCKDCVKAQRAEYNARPEVKAHRAEYRANNHEAIRAYSAEYNARPEVKARSAEYYAQNRDTICARNAENYARPEVRARKAEYRAEYHSAKPHIAWESEYRTRARSYGFEPVIVSFTKQELIDHYGDKCFHCGGPFDELDHYPVPIVRGGAHTIEGCKPSCAPCNWKSWRQSV